MAIKKLFLLLFIAIIMCSCPDNTSDETKRVLIKTENLKDTINVNDTIWVTINFNNQLEHSQINSNCDMSFCLYNIKNDSIYAYQPIIINTEISFKNDKNYFILNKTNDTFYNRIGLKFKKGINVFSSFYGNVINAPINIVTYLELNSCNNNILNSIKILNPTERYNILINDTTKLYGGSSYYAFYVKEAKN